MMINLIKTMIHTITRPIQNLIISYLRYLVGFPSLTHHHHDTGFDSNITTVIIEDSNELYTATRSYLYTKLNLDPIKFYVGESNLDDVYQGMEVKWRIFLDKNIRNITRECFELRFDKKHRNLVFNSYLPFVESKGKKTILEMHTYSHCFEAWETKSLEHHLTFETIVMKEELKRGLMADLDQFIRRKDFYTRVGRSWTRNYLLYGPPGTGKTSLVAAMAKYLNLDVYDLKLSGALESNFDPRRLILGVMDSSILVVEDIDCSLEGTTSVLALSQLLSCLAGFWSNAEEARIVIFTTNKKEMLDPTLLCRMHMKIHMEHCCFEGFKNLASNYLGLSHDNDDAHRLYPDIKRLIDGQVVTPAQVAEALIKSEDVDVALEGLVSTLEMKSLVIDDE